MPAYTQQTYDKYHSIEIYKKVIDECKREKTSLLALPTPKKNIWSNHLQKIKLFETSIS